MNTFIDNEMVEIEYITERFQDSNILEVQAWNETTADFFSLFEYYEVFHSSDGSYWITDTRRYLD